jgi:hypothetical protein
MTQGEVLIGHNIKQSLEKNGIIGLLASLEKNRDSGVGYPFPALALRRV